MAKFTLRKLRRPEREIWSMLDEVVTEKSACTEHIELWLAHPGRCHSHFILFYFILFLFF